MIVKMNLLKITLVTSLLLSIYLTTSSPNSNENVMEIDEKKTFMLIHGSWHSAWNWYRIIPLLEQRGHRVIAPDLPGMGRDKTPVEEVTFDNNVKRIIELIDAEPNQVILVGHSKNGVLISQAAEYRPDKIEKLVYLAAVLAADGKSAVDYFQLDTEGILGPYVTNYPETNSSTLDPEIYKEGLYHDCDDEITEMAKVLLSHEPRQTATEPIRITEKNYGSIPKYYIELTEVRAITPFLQKKCILKCPLIKCLKWNQAILLFFVNLRNL
jgi:pimeloyl-ACP methyl ester carboxylesterase